WSICLISTTTNCCRVTLPSACIVWMKGCFVRSVLGGRRDDPEIGPAHDLLACSVAMAQSPNREVSQPAKLDHDARTLESVKRKGLKQLVKDMLKRSLP